MHPIRAVTLLQSYGTGSRPHALRTQTHEEWQTHKAANTKWGDDRLSRTGRDREIGPAGSVARIVVGLAALALGILGGQLTLIEGQVRTHFEIVPVVVGIAVFPAVVLTLQWLRARQAPARLQATGPVATSLNILLFVALVLTPSYAPPLSITSDAALVFYGGSMLVAALRGYGGCEVLAISNWLLHRDDQIGCLVFSPLDDAERYLTGAARPG